MDRVRSWGGEGSSSFPSCRSLPLLCSSGEPPQPKVRRNSDSRPSCCNRPARQVARRAFRSAGCRCSHAMHEGLGRQLTGSWGLCAWRSGIRHGTLVVFHGLIVSPVFTLLNVDGGPVECGKAR